MCLTKRKARALLISFACMFAIINGGFARAEDHLYSWTRALGAGVSEWGFSQDKEGGFIITGSFSGTVDFDPGPTVENHTSNGSGDIFLCRYDKFGNYHWTRTVGGPNNDYGRGIVATASGDIYLTGKFYGGPTDFDPGPGTDIETSTADTMFLSKYDIDGNYYWTKRVYASGVPSYGHDVVQDSHGNLFIVGRFNGTINFNPDGGTDNHTALCAPSVCHDAFVSKYDASGNYLWTKNIGGSTPPGELVAIDSNDNLIFSGSFKGTVDFDSGTGVDNRTSQGQTDAYITKLDNDGNYLWTRTIGGSDYEGSYAVASDGSGSLYIVGYFQNTVDFDFGAGVDNRTSQGQEDAFITKLDSNGNYLWTKTIGGSGYDDVYGVSTDSSGNVYFGGAFQNTVDFDFSAGVDNRTSQGSADAFITKLDNNGNYLWTRTFGGTLWDYVEFMLTDTNNNLFLVGWFNDVVDFNPGVEIDNLGSSGSGGTFLSKYTFDNTSPPAPIVTSPVTGTSTNTPQPTISGTAEANTMITIYLNGTNSGTSTVDGSGAWTLTPSSPWLDGTYSITATATDIANNTSALSIAVVLTIDTVNPPAPVITVPSSGTQTTNNKPVISGTAETNSTVTIYSDGISLSTTLANGSGAWSYTPASALMDGSHSLTTTATDAANNTSDLSSALSLIIDTIPPSTSALIPPVWGNKTDALTPGFSGTGDAGQTVRVWLDNNLAGTASINQVGNWSWTPSSDLSLGSHSIEFSVVDEAGNESARSGMRSFQVVDDYDNDGLTTAEEVAGGTDPHNSDSDDDWVTDGQEVQDGTNPTNSDTDSDGLTDGQEKQYRTNPKNRDSDLDGVTDGQEIQEGTSPLDRGSAQATRDTTLCTEWNGFLGMWNVLEHLNQGGAKLNIESTIKDLFGAAQGTRTFGLKPGYQYDLLVHDMAGHQANSYGLVCSSATNGHHGDLDGRMVFYKADLDTGGYQYAFAVPLGNGLTGKQYISYNTYQPSLDPQDAGNLAANWIQLTNLSTSKQTGSLVFYDREGEEIARQSVTLKAGARFDYSAHDMAGIRKVGLVEWLPTANEARFQLRNVRYYYRADGVQVPLGDDFDSAFQLEGVIGSGELLAVPLDTAGSSAVLELANTLAEEVRAEVTIYLATGDTSLYQQTYKLKPHATYHLIVDSVLNGKKGIATIKANKPESVVATAMQYGRTASHGIQTAYGIQASEPLGTIMRGSYNTFLKQGCRLLMANPTSVEIATTVSIKRYDGTEVEAGRDFSIPAHGLTDYDLCAEDEENVYGVVTVQPATPNTVLATVLRIGESEQYRFPTPVRE